MKKAVWLVVIWLVLVAGCSTAEKKLSIQEKETYVINLKAATVANAATAGVVDPKWVAGQIGLPPEVVVSDKPRIYTKRRVIKSNKSNGGLASVSVTAAPILETKQLPIEPVAGCPYCNIGADPLNPFQPLSLDEKLVILSRDTVVKMKGKTREYVCKLRAGDPGHAIVAGLDGNWRRVNSCGNTIINAGDIDIGVVNKQAEKPEITVAQTSQPKQAEILEEEEYYQPEFQAVGRPKMDSAFESVGERVIRSILPGSLPAAIGAYGYIQGQKAHQPDTSTTNVTTTTNTNAANHNRGGIATATANPTTTANGGAGGAGGAGGEGGLGGSGGSGGSSSASTGSATSTSSGGSSSSSSDSSGSSTTSGTTSDSGSSGSSGPTGGASGSTGSAGDSGSSGPVGGAS